MGKMDKMCHVIQRLDGKMPIESILWNFIMKMIQSIFCKVWERPFCRTEIHFGHPCLCRSTTPMRRVYKRLFPSHIGSMQVVLR